MNLIMATDASGQMVWSKDYDPYGNEGRVTGDGDTRELTFHHYQRIADAGLVYVGARWYSPGLRRFISPDPVGVPDAAVTGVNRFHYGLDNPLAYTDPDGEFVNLIVGALAGAAIDAAMQGVFIATGVQDEFKWGQVAGAAAMGVVGGGVFSKGVQLVKALKRGKTVAKTAANFSQKQLAKKFKHASDFGVNTTKKNPKTFAEFQNAITSHLDDAATVQKGTYGFVKDSKVFF